MYRVTTLLDEILLEAPVTSMPTLRYGARGSKVVYLQTRLNHHKASLVPLKEDGIWGPKTHAAVLAFQRQHFLKVDGVVGPLTWAALQKNAELVEVCFRPPVNQAEFNFIPPKTRDWLGMKPRIRSCCLLAPRVGPWPWADPANLGRHNAVYMGPGSTNTEDLGQLYTGNAGFIDLGHLRDLCDLTRYVHGQLVKGKTTIETTHGSAVLSKPCTDPIAVAKAIAFHDSLGYEIQTFAIKSVGKHNSSFSPEDLCSNNLGTLIAESALKSIASGAGNDFDNEVTRILNDTLKVLNVQPPGEAKKAFDLINMNWVHFTKFRDRLSDAYLRKRNFCHIPWKAGHSSDGPTPSWLLEDPLKWSSFYDYTHTVGRRINQADFPTEIAAIRVEAAKLYGPDFDKPFAGATLPTCNMTVK